MIKRLSFALALTALIAGCSSGVDLDNIPVEDKSGSALPTTGANGANSGNTGQSAVAGVDLSQSGRDAAGPVGMSRVVLFDYDSYVIRSDYQSLIETHARFIKASPARKVMLEGHTDDRVGIQILIGVDQQCVYLRLQALQHMMVERTAAADN